MILIQILLIFLLTFVLVRFLASRSTSRTQAWKKIIFIIFILTAIGFVIRPDISNTLANFVGVGRGADLLLYILTIGFIFQQFNTYVKQKEEQKQLVKLVRRVALLEAALNERSNR